jgi:hypothetical protein
MDLYWIAVDQFVIHNTRALHNDTLSLAYSAHVNGDVVASHTVPLGDHDNGTYSPSLLVPPGESAELGPVVINDPAAAAVFTFQLVNAGNIDHDSLTGRLRSTAGQIATLAGVGLPGVGVKSDDPISLMLKAFPTVWSWLMADCDGPVAADQVSGPRYVLDLWTDNIDNSVQYSRKYPGSDSATGCGGNSDYEVTWSLRHARTWTSVVGVGGAHLASGEPICATTHNGAVHVFSLDGAGAVRHARTLTGATWDVDAEPLALHGLIVRAACAESFDDRCHLLGRLDDGHISPLVYTVDGNSWFEDWSTPLPEMTTGEPFATSVFAHRLHVVASDSSTGQLRVTSTPDLLTWSPWVNLPSPGLARTSAPAAAALDDQLFVFAVFDTLKAPNPLVVMRTSSADGASWTPWTLVESGFHPQNAATDRPLDVAAGTSGDRVYIATRWQPTTGAPETPYIAHNFSEDGQNWSGWRRPPANTDFRAATTPGLAAVGNHLYTLAARADSGASDDLSIWAY